MDNIYWTLAEDQTRDTEWMHHNRGMRTQFTKEQKDGWGLFYVTNILGPSNERKADNVTHIRGVIADFDTEAAEGLDPKSPEGEDSKFDPIRVESFIQNTLADVASIIPLAPTSIVRTAKGLHYTWLFNEPLEKTDELVVLYRHIPELLNSDPACKDVSRLLRVPGSMHWKRGKPIPVVTLKNEPDNTYSLKEIKQAFYFNPKPKNTTAPIVDTDSIFHKFNTDPTHLTIHTILKNAGWKRIRDGSDYYTRPGKESGVSGHVLYDGLTELFFCFTSSAEPLEAYSTYNKSYLLQKLQLNDDGKKLYEYLRTMYQIKEPILQIGIVHKKLELKNIPEYCLTGSIGEMVAAWGNISFPALVASVQIAGAACGKNKYVLDGGYIKPSLFCLFSGAPSSGKTVYVSIIENTIKNLGVKMGGSPESGQSMVRIMSGLHKVPVNTLTLDDKGKKKKEYKLITTKSQQTLFAIDEFATVVRTSSGPSSTLMPVMRSAYMARSVSNASLSNARDIGNGETLTAEDPFVYITGALTEKDLQELIRSSDFELGGLASRFIFTRSDFKKRTSSDRKSGRVIKINEPALFAAANKIYQTVPKITTPDGSFDEEMPIPDYTDYLTDEIAVYDDSIADKYNLVPTTDSDAAYNRAGHNAKAIAYIYMLARGSNMLSREDIDAGWWIVAKSMEIYEEARTEASRMVVEDKKWANDTALQQAILSVISDTKQTAREIVLTPSIRRKVAKVPMSVIRSTLESLVTHAGVNTEVVKNEQNKDKVLYWL